MYRYTLNIAGMSVVLFVLVLLPIATPLQDVEASEHPILYLFWGDGCPHCEEEKEFLEILQQDYPQLEMRFFEVWNHPEFVKPVEAMRKAYGIKSSSVPMTFLGDWNLVGFKSFETTGVEMAAQVERCLEQSCPDALSKAGPLKIAAKIQDEAARKAPQGWELFPAKTEKKLELSEAAATAKIVVYYFHGNYRCPSCTTIEELTNFAVTEGFKEELQDGVLEFKVINMETPENGHFIKDYQLYTKSVIVSEVVDGKEVRWKNLEKVWQLFMKEKAFTEYVQEEVSAYLEEAQP